MEQLPAAFYQAIAELQRSGEQLVLVHGGGPMITEMLSKMEIPPRFIEGLRYTCEATMDVVEMVLGGSINKRLVRRLLQAGCRAWGLSGIDGGMISARQTDQPLGLVGEIVSVETSLLVSLLDQGYLPVVAPLGVEQDGRQVYNINADVAAGAVAAALGANKLLMVTDVPGILIPDGDSLVCKQTVDPHEIAELIEKQVITGGMIPKVRSALAALEQGVEEVVICRGTPEDLHGIFAGKPVGTSLRKSRDERSATMKGVSV
ncbi:acetylglutamate kinase [Brevibacillus humidisoli]|uniref:acetylglutamate kinase n=1 Tax=Brevibacillus humidisoli TaxID=2895522 RepID=UPI001E410052|nr:acetylglutamate kinase [Brevibacillus humidisoli]